MRDKPSGFGHLTMYAPYIMMAIVVITAVYVRIRLLQVPLERDEGEYAYMGQLLLKGIPPYLHAYSMKLPGASICYALIMALFGQTPSGIHLGLLLVNTTCILFIFLLAKRLFDRETACIAAASFALLSLSKTVYGFFAHATHFILIFALAGCILLLRSIDKNRISLLFGSGLCFGLAFIMKQPAIFLLIFAIIHILRQGRIYPEFGKTVSPSGLALFIIAALIPYALVILWVIKAGTFDTFWFWTITYAREYASSLTFGEGILALIKNFSVIYKPHPFLWGLALAGGCLILLRKGRCADRLFVGGFFLFSFLAISPGFYFRWHYFIIILPAVALLAGVAGTAIGDMLATVKSGGVLLSTLIPSLLVLAIIGYGFHKERECFFQISPQEVSYSTYGKSPFPAAPEIGRYLMDHTSEGDRIALIGSEPEIYFYAGRLSATGHIYMYSLMENHPHAEQLQRELIREVERSMPKYCVFADFKFSWLIGPASPRLIFSWFGKYMKEHYEQVGIIELYDNTWLSYWDAYATKHVSGSDAAIVVYRRKN